MTEKKRKKGHPSSPETNAKISAAFKASGRRPPSHVTHGMSHHEHFQRWRKMVGRCMVPRDPKYKDYGGRGIAVCEEWLDPAVFCAWMDANLGPCPPGSSIDRVDNDGNYEPGNVRWATRIEQQGNRRPTVCCPPDCACGRHRKCPPDCMCGRHHQSKCSPDCTCGRHYRFGRQAS